MEFGLRKPRLPSMIPGRVFEDPEHSEEEERFQFAQIEFGGTAPGDRSLLSGIRFRDSDHLSAQGKQEGEYIL